MALFLLYVIAPTTKQSKAKQSKAKQMTSSIRVYVPYVELPDAHADAQLNFAKRAFEDEYGEGSVKDVVSVPKCDGYFHTLTVHLECVTDEALSKIAALNSGETLLLDVEYWVGSSVASRAKWRCMKFRQEKCSMRDEKNEDTIKEVVALVPKSTTFETLGHLIREAIEHTTHYRDDVSNTMHSLDTSRVGDEEEHGEDFAKLEALEAQLLDALKTNLVMARATYTQIKIIKIRQDLIKGRIVSKA